MSATNLNEISQAIKPLMQALGTIEVQLRALNRMNTLHALYERDEVKPLVARYKTLMEADGVAHEALSKASDVLRTAFGNVSFEDRVVQFGVDAARGQSAPIEAALEGRKATSAALGAFCAQHPLIVELVGGSHACP